MNHRGILVSLFLLAGLAGPALHAAPVRVPQDARTLEAAISRVADGGVIEMAAGTYPSPPNGFTISNARKGFTIRPAAGAAVAIDGGGVRPLVRLVNSDRGRGKRVTFERITFQNGFSAESNRSGGVTLSEAEAFFRNCSFVNNRAAASNTGGGAVKVIEDSAASFFNSSFRGNSSQHRGGALSVRNSTLTIQGGDFTGNRTNLPGHLINAFGGAVMVVDATVRVSGVRFENNEAGWVGGAIFIIGNWDKSGSDVQVTGSTFVGNQAVADPCCAHPDIESSAGAIHAEDLTTLRVQQSLFQRNRADNGSAIGAYRAVVEVSGSVFQANQPTLTRPEMALGGAIAAFSSDQADASSQFGAINRRSARLLIAQSLLQGGPEVTRRPIGGGCVLAAGDASRAYGDGAVPQAGTLAENRARVEIRNVVFSDCDIDTAADGTGGLGGALGGDLIDLVMEDSMFLDSDARGTGASGGGVALRQESNARIVRTTFARNSAQRAGGALFIGGSTVQVDDCRFFGNDVVPGSFEGVGDSRGAAIHSIPQLTASRPRNVGGVVANSVFSENVGLPLSDVDPASGPINEMRYNGNRIDSNHFGSLVYVNNLAAPGGVNVPTLNSLTVFRGGSSTRKSEVPNTSLFNPREGALRVVPSPNSVGAGAPAPNSSFLAFAWSGGFASIGATNLGSKAGLMEVPAGNYTLAVNGTAVASVSAPATCTAGSVLCLNANRFRAEVTFKANGATGIGQAANLSGDTGSFWFFDPANVELVVKVLDGRGLNGHFWVFFGALTNLEYTLTVTDTATGAVKNYHNPAGRFASAGDTSAFAASTASTVAPLTAVAFDDTAGGDLEPIADEASTCAAGDTRLCLNGSRFAVELTWKDFAGRTGSGHAVPLSGDTGLFWFTSPNNVEVILKVLDARGLNGHFWVFFGALTNQEYTIRVTDTVTGRNRTYVNPLGKFGSRGDTEAIPGN
jgi:hypothetical protein